MISWWWNWIKYGENNLINLAHQILMHELCVFMLINMCLNVKHVNWLCINVINA